MSCPLNRNRWAGSGYVKQPETAESKVLNDKMAAMQAERSAQDAKLFPSASNTCPGGVCPIPVSASKQSCGNNGGLCKKK